MPLAPRDERDLICPSHPSGIATASPVRIFAETPFDTFVSSKALKSQPAADFVPWDGCDASGSILANRTSTLSLCICLRREGGTQDLWLFLVVINSNFEIYYYTNSNRRYHKPPTLV